MKNYLVAGSILLIASAFWEPIAKRGMEQNLPMAGYVCVGCLALGIWFLFYGVIKDE